MKVSNHPEGVALPLLPGGIILGRKALKWPTKNIYNFIRLYFITAKSMLKMLILKVLVAAEFFPQQPSFYGWTDLRVLAGPGNSAPFIQAS